MTNARRLLAAAPFVALVVAALALPADAGGPVSPDGWIKKSGGSYKGVGENDPSEASDAQTVSRKVTPGGTAVFKAKAQNPGVTRDLRFEGDGSSGAFKAKYLVGGENVTNDTVIGLLEFADVPAGGTTATVRIEVKAKNSAAPGAEHTGGIVFYDPTAPEGSDDHLGYRVKVI